MAADSYYQWTFEIKDVVKFDETTVTVSAQTYKEAVKKIKGLKIPQLDTYTDIEEGMRLQQVYEVDENIDPFEEEQQP